MVLIMKKSIFIAICFAIICSFIFTGCESKNNSENIENESIVINNETYEPIEADWTVFGSPHQDGEYYLYDYNSKAIFAKTEDTSLFEGVFYHNTNDAYPDITMTDRIDKIVLETEDKQVTIKEDMADRLIAELSNSSSSKPNTATYDATTTVAFVNVYYKDYPAYQNEFMLCYSNDDEMGFAYCLTEKNNEKFGDYNNMALFSDEQLIDYLESLKLIEKSK